MSFQEKLPMIMYDNKCYLCDKFAKMVDFLARGKIAITGHYTDLGEKIRNQILDSSALEMFWFINGNMAYGGRAALIPLMKAILGPYEKKFKNFTVAQNCDVGCKSTKAVFIRSASLFTNSKKIFIN